MKHLGLFEGIGGFSLAAQWMNWETVAWVEKDKFCQTIMEKNFPNAKGYSDIKKFDGKAYRGAVDIITGGFPCQPYSTNGKRRGDEDDRALWKEMFRVIREVQPAFVVGENVYGLISMDGGAVLENIHLDLESTGYKVQSFIIPACGVKAPHKRDRIWIIAENTNRNAYGRMQAKGGFGEQRNLSSAIQIQPTADTPSGNELQFDRKQKDRQISQLGKDTIHSPFTGYGKEGDHWENDWFDAASKFCRVANGLPERLDKNRRKRLKALGNAVVPQVAYRIFQGIQQSI